MKDPREYTKAMVVSQVFLTAVYAIVGIIVYYYAGSYNTSPALGPAGPFMKKICYRLALPGLLVSTILCRVRPHAIALEMPANKMHRYPQK